MPIRLLTVGSDPDNTLFGVDPDGTLRWYRYVGGAQADAAASTAPWLGWDPNSGNPIGNGWGDFSWLGAGIQGTLLGVDGQGNLRRYYYTGSGQSDSTVTRTGRRSRVRSLQPASMPGSTSR